MQTTELEIMTEQATADDVLRTAMDVGEGLLRSGAEIRRIEDTITRIAKAYGAVHVEVFTITTLILASVRMPDGGYSSQTRRVLTSSNNLHRLAKYNEISREICAGGVSIEAAQQKIRQVKRSEPYPTWIIYIGAVFGAGGFAMFFGGSWLDGIIAAAIGVIMTLIDTYKPPFMNSMSNAVISSFIAGVLAELCAYFGLCHNMDMVIIGTIMLLIPGLTIGTSIRDMLCGDIVTGSIRLIQSILLACVIAFGYGAAMLLMGGILV